MFINYLAILENWYEWRDYKAVSLHGSVCGAFFQDNKSLIQWVNRQPLSRAPTCVGDGHDGIWNVIKDLAPHRCRREVLDWYHLVENLYKLGGAVSRLKRFQSLLWSGLVDEVIEELRGLRRSPALRLKAYLVKHRHRIIPYDLFQGLGLAIGSGGVESTIKRIAARVKLTGAQWLPGSVARILRLRCAYLNGAFQLSAPLSA